MNKTKLSAHQLFSLIVLFELGSAIVVGVGKEAKQDAWLAVLLGMVAGLGLFMIYGWLHKLYPELSLSNILEKVLGKWLGRLLGVLYILYFLYISCRLLRDFGALLLTAALPETPIYIVTFMMALVIVYASYLGIETIGKTGELLYIFYDDVGTCGTRAYFDIQCDESGEFDACFGKRMEAGCERSLSAGLHLPLWRDGYLHYAYALFARSPSSHPDRT